eukprot:CAMPEP_0204599614 /NCGR_PEP_ID=MMETSP0661-20131031/54933_1 /ASSEMBLY_ACC=CAM_ASM_000606 /TAXON_ID=109239 /ORGANISM="Alexandrium margalefi, Strain AMGDE01CS-322" /LENGTH=146 /DNA_ID=CAMNT_0051610359 /DNA_START=77 /DNA_END=517 /DNA_ORIENTATION=-
MARSLLLLALVAAHVAPAGTTEAEAENLNNIKAGASLHAHSSALRAEMHSMMADAEDDVDFGRLSRKGQDESGRGSLQRSGPSGGTASLDDYIKDAEEGLSASLGPRWDAKRLEDDANTKTRALLRGISGPRATGAISRMMGAMIR